ncbi:MAG: class I adenylate-forming enzyme family protein [Burkholderiaceae bacterium]|nr:class I adenylate-forming enzyme family protein [Burkholderiaceae bacterium]
MDIGLILKMAADGAADRRAVGAMGYQQLLDTAAALAARLGEMDATTVGFLGVNSPAVPVVLFASAIAGKPFVPLNYRLDNERLQAQARRCAPAVIITDDDMKARLDGIAGVQVISTSEAFAAQGGAPDESVPPDPDDVAVMLFTSGTTSEPKAALLRHRHLASYVLGTVEFMGADEDECALVSVPPYHIAGISAILSSIFGGRRMVQLDAFEPERWVELVRREKVTHAMLVPTMLRRILDVLSRTGQTLPDLRHLSYGGGKMGVPTIEMALKMLPHVNFVNAYGLTETSSTIALLGPDDHRAAFASEDPLVRARLGSVGKPLPSVEIEIRDGDRPVPAGRRGEIHVRGDQISGEYAGRNKTAEGDDWFGTRDCGHMDEEGFLFIEGRLDDVIIRGGENTSPGEIEEVLLEHPLVADVGVVGVPDAEWGEAIAAGVVLHPGASVPVEDLQAWVRTRLRSSKTPSRIEFMTALPYNETGKLLRRELRTQFSASET